LSDTSGIDCQLTSTQWKWIFSWLVIHTTTTTTTTLESSLTGTAAVPIRIVDSYICGPIKIDRKKNTTKSFCGLCAWIFTVGRSAGRLSFAAGYSRQKVCWMHNPKGIEHFFFFFLGSPLCRLARSIDEKQTATLEKYNNNSVWNWNCVVPTVVTFEGICVSIGEKKWFHDVIRCLLLSFLRGPTRFSKADKYVPNNFFYSSSEKFDISPTRLTEIPPIIRHSLPLKSAFKK
jgi:hypothetical protein